MTAASNDHRKTRPAPARKSPPRDYDALRQKIVAEHGTLSRRLRLVADYALANPNQIALDTVAVLAARIEVAPSVLIRFAQALGYSGFSDLQEVYRARLTSLVPSYNDRIRHLLTEPGRAADPAGLLGRFVDGGIHALEHLRATTSPEKIDAAVDILAKANTIHIAGFRRSYPVANYLLYSLIHLSCRVHPIDNAGGMLKAQMSTMSAGDALVLVTFYPYATEALELLEQAGRQGIPVVSITDTTGGPLEAADVCFEVDEASDTKFRSLNACITLALTLVVAFGQRLEKGGKKKR
jgi:DNA-binding MurR/RpiR family transcriptional regulator